MRDITVIDNYDSFVYNLCDYMGTMKKTKIKVYRNDQITVGEVLKQAPDLVVISPGPGRPEEAGISIDLIRNCKGEIPVLGICLGHQCLAVAHGARVIKTGNIMHGKTSPIFYNKAEKIFNGIDNPFSATRYHSLIVDPNSMANNLKIIARTGKDEIMGIKHVRYPQYGLQFHPESILTGAGYELLENIVTALSERKSRV